MCILHVLKKFFCNLYVEMIQSRQFLTLLYITNVCETLCVMEVVFLHVYVVFIPFQLESGESDDDSIDWGMSSSSSSESDAEVGGTGYYTVEYFLKK